MILVKAYEISRLWTILRALRASYASCGIGSASGTPLYETVEAREKTTYEEEGEDNAADEEPFADSERDEDTTVVFVCGAGVEDLVLPCITC